MKKTFVLLNQFLNVVMAVALAIMAILVFGNVVLRYGFNSGITWAQELSRYLFILLTFVGAIGALKGNQHLGMDSIIKRLPNLLKKAVYLITSTGVLFLLWLLFDGSITVTKLSIGTKSPAIGLPLEYIYGIGIVTSVSMAFIVVFNIIRVFRDKNAIHELTSIRESEEKLPHKPHSDSDSKFTSTQEKIAK